MRPEPRSAPRGAASERTTSGPVFEYLDRLDIGFWFIIGGNDSADTGHTLHLKARDIGYDLTVVNVPKTIDNDLVLTDHCPGFGSAARFVSMAVMGSGLDAEAMKGASPITIFEVMGRDAGWLAASAALAKREERDAPHLICVPEFPIDEDTFRVQGGRRVLKVRLCRRSRLRECQGRGRSAWSGV